MVEKGCSQSCSRSSTSSTASSSQQSQARKSTVWGFFDKDGISAVKCRLCQSKMAYHGSTSSLKEHLKRKHPLQFSEAEQPVAKKQKMIDTYTRRSTCSSDRAAVITNLVAGVIIRDLRPINMVNGEAFQALMRYLEPGYHLPSDTHFTNLIERMYAAVKEKVCHQFSEKAEHLSITGDIWTSIATHAYLTVTVHYLDSEWELKSISLGAIPLDDTHTGENIQVWIKDLLLEFGASHEKITSFVHDNGSNIDLAGRMLEEEKGWVTLGCAGHTLQLCVNSGLKINRQIDKAIAAARKIVTHFRKSEPAMRALRIRQSDMRAPSHCLIQDVATRWNSTFFMIERLLEQRWPITAVLSDPTVTKNRDRYLDLKSDQWDLLQALKVVLHPLQVATTYLSAEYNTSISALLPVLFGSIKSLELSDDDLPSIRQAKAEISSQIQSRWQLNEITISNNFYLLSSYLDPRFKDCKFLTIQQKMEMKLLIINLLAEIKENSSVEVIETSAPELQQSATALDLLLGSENGSTHADEEDPIMQEVDQYLKEPNAPRESSPLLWWKANQQHFPLTTKLAKKYLGIPATSTPSERVFSTAGLTVTRLRSCLTPDHVNMLVFLNKNYALLDN